MAGSDRRLEVFVHLNVEKAAVYRAVVRVFFAAKERFRLHLRPAEVVGLLGDGGHPPVPDEVPSLLAQLVDWGNLRADPDNAAVATVEEFYRPRFLYQLTAEGEAAERAIRHFEDALIRPGELQTAALDDIRALLRELAALAGDSDLDGPKTHRVLTGLTSRFAELTDRAQVFIANLQRTIDLQGLDLDAFVVYKDRLVDYLERFLGDLVLTQAEVAGLVAEVERAGVDRLLEAAADRDLADALEVDDDDHAATRLAWRQRWEGLRGWFVAADAGDQAQADVLRTRARQAIPALLLAVAQINEQRVSRTDRAADLRAVARWFAQAPTDVDAHRLWRAAFGLAPARHLQIDADTLDRRAVDPVLAATSWLDADPLQIAPRLRRTGRYQRRGRPTSVVDRSHDKALLAAQAAEEARQLAEARRRLATDGCTRLSALGRLGPDEFGLLLDLLGEALGRKIHATDDVRAVSADGSLEIVLRPTADGASATIDSEDGALHGPDHHVEIRDLLADDDRTTRTDAVAGALAEVAP